MPCRSGHVVTVTVDEVVVVHTGGVHVHTVYVYIYIYICTYIYTSSVVRLIDI